MVNRTDMLDVRMNDISAGRLIKEENGALKFHYLDSWLKNEYTRPVSLSLPLIKKTFTGKEVYNFFDNLLPNNPEIRANLQARFSIKSSEPFDLLKGIGRDCIGSIQLTKTDERHLLIIKITGAVL